MREILLFVCSQMADETILALNCLLLTEQERSEEESSVGDALALAFRCARFCSASLILFASYSPVRFLMRPRYFSLSCAIYSHDSVDMLKNKREGNDQESVQLTSKGKKYKHEITRS